MVPKVPRLQVWTPQRIWSRLVNLVWRRVLLDFQRWCSLFLHIQFPDIIATCRKWRVQKRLRRSSHTLQGQEWTQWAPDWCQCNYSLHTGWSMDWLYLPWNRGQAYLTRSGSRVRVYYGGSALIGGQRVHCPCASLSCWSVGSETYHSEVRGGHPHSNLIATTIATTIGQFYLAEVVGRSFALLLLSCCILGYALLLHAEISGDSTGIWLSYSV